MNQNSTLKPQELHILGVQIVSLVLSLVLGLMATLFNSALLFTLYKDPLKCFQRRSSTAFIQALALSDLLTGIFVQPCHSISLLFQVITERKVGTLDRIVFYGSHFGAKVSILTLIMLAVDRLMAIVLPWRYRSILTRKRARLLNGFIWMFVVLFEAGSHTILLSAVLHHIDVHLQTTIPMTSLLLISIATYLSFRRHSRNTVFSESHHNQHSIRNSQYEKKIIVTILLVLLVVIMSLVPYLVVEQVDKDCNHYHDYDHKNDDICKQTVVKFHVLSVSLLCVSCAMNPILYGWRVPDYRQSFWLVFSSTFRAKHLVNQSRPNDIEMAIPSIPVPSVPISLVSNQSRPNDIEMAIPSIPVPSVPISLVSNQSRPNDIEMSIPSIPVPSIPIPPVTIE